MIPVAAHRVATGVKDICFTYHFCRNLAILLLDGDAWGTTSIT
jgi:hypothetical protein